VILCISPQPVILVTEWSAPLPFPPTHNAWRRPRYIGIAKCRPGAGDSAALMTGKILFVLVLVLVLIVILLLILILDITSRFISLLR
jgi:hypothetical protein